MSKICFCLSVSVNLRVEYIDEIVFFDTLQKTAYDVSQTLTAYLDLVYRMPNICDYRIFSPHYDNINSNRINTISLIK
jgi:hypothetical protein